MTISAPRTPAAPVSEADIGRAHTAYQIREGGEAARAKTAIAPQARADAAEEKDFEPLARWLFEWRHYSKPYDEMMRTASSDVRENWIKLARNKAPELARLSFGLPPAEDGTPDLDKARAAVWAENVGVLAGIARLLGLPDWTDVTVDAVAAAMASAPEGGAPTLSDALEVAITAHADANDELGEGPRDDADAPDGAALVTAARRADIALRHAIATHTDAAVAATLAADRAVWLSGVPDQRLLPMEDAPRKGGVEILAYDDHGYVSLVHKTLASGWTCINRGQITYDEDRNILHVGEEGPYEDGEPKAIGWLPIRPHPYLEVANGEIPVSATDRAKSFGKVRDAFEVWAADDNRDLAAETYEERTPDNGLYYQANSTNDAYIGWRAATLRLAILARLSVPSPQLAVDHFGDVTEMVHDTARVRVSAAPGLREAVDLVRRIVLAADDDAHAHVDQEVQWSDACEVQIITPTGVWPVVATLGEFRLALASAKADGGIEPSGKTGELPRTCKPSLQVAPPAPVSAAGEASR